MKMPAVKLNDEYKNIKPNAQDISADDASSYISERDLKNLKEAYADALAGRGVSYTAEQMRERTMAYLAKLRTK